MAQKYINIKTGKEVSLNAEYLPVSILNTLKPITLQSEEIPDVLTNQSPIKHKRNGKK